MPYLHQNNSQQTGAFPGEYAVSLIPCTLPCSHQNAGCCLLEKPGALSYLGDECCYFTPKSRMHKNLGPKGAGGSRHQRPV